MHPLQYLRASLAVCLVLSSACAAVPAPGGAPPPDPCNVATAPPRVQLFGGIKRPGALAYEHGLTVYGAITRAGGLELSAVARQVRIVRCGRAIGPFPVPTAAGAPDDVPLEKGDVLDIPVEVF